MKKAILVGGLHDGKIVNSCGQDVLQMIDKSISPLKLDNCIKYSIDKDGNAIKDFVFDVNLKSQTISLYHKHFFEYSGRVYELYFHKEVCGWLANSEKRAIFMDMLRKNMLDFQYD